MTEKLRKKQIFKRQSEPPAIPFRHPFRRRLIGILLSICLVAAAMPVEYYSFPVQAASNVQEILSFLDLPEEIRTQTTAVGTAMEELNLPDTLKAVCRLEIPSSERDFPFMESIPDLETASNLETASDLEVASNLETASDLEALPTDNNETEAADVTTTIIAISEITWTSAPFYEANLPGVYTFTPNLPEDYSLSLDAEVPKIIVTLTDNTNSGENLSGEDAESDAENGSENNFEDPKQEPGNSQNPENGSENEPDSGQKENGSNSEPDSGQGENGSNSEHDSGQQENSQVPPVKETPENSSDEKESQDYASSGNENEQKDETEAPMRRKITAFNFENGSAPIAETEAPKADETIAVEIPYNQTGDIIIDKDTIWAKPVSSLPMYRTLQADRIIFQNNATLTINNIIVVDSKISNFTISGTGTIKRAQEDAHFAFNHKNLTINDITFDGNSVPASAPMLAVTSGTLQLDRCKFQNCNFTAKYYDIGYPSSSTLQEKKPASALYLDNVNNQTTPDTALINNLEIKNCTGQQAIYTYRSCFSVRGGDFQNISPCSIHISTTKCFLTDCNFINAADTEGAIYFSDFSLNSANKQLPHPNTELHLKNISFQGNTHAPGSGHDNSPQPPYAVYRNGAGALFYMSTFDQDYPILEFNNVRFYGDNTNSGTDGFLMYNLYETSTYPPKINISSPLASPIAFSLFARKDIVIAVGTDGYQLTQNDVKKLNLINLNQRTSDQTWYPVLDTAKNQIYLDSKDPGYDYSLIYNSNGAAGIVQDDTLYPSGKTAAVKPADGLTRVGYDFICWNTEPDRSGTDYYPGDSIEITKDTTLYAIFQELGKQTFTAVFYSGNPWKKTTLSTTVSIPSGGNSDTVSGTLTTPELAELSYWTPCGWTTEPSGHAIDALPNTDISLTKPVTIFYGVYRKETTLQHQAPGTDMETIRETADQYANTHKEITYEPAKFTVREEPKAPDGYTFEAWYLDGKTYQNGDIVEISKNSVITARYSKPVTAYFYYGEEIQKYSKTGTLYNTTKGFTFNLSFSFASFPGWQFVGFDRDSSGFEAPLKSGPNQVTITEDTDFYCIYKKDVTISYYTSAGTSRPPNETKEARANVHEPEIGYQLAEFTLAEGPSLPGCVFLGWNTQRDGKGTMYSAKETLKRKDNLQLYAIYEIRETYFSADFYSGNEIEKETKTVTVEGDAASGTLHTPGLKKLDGYEPVGWAKDKYSIFTQIKAGDPVTLTNHGVYYGVYEKNVTLHYDTNGGSGGPKDDTKQFKAIVTENGINYTTYKFTIYTTIYPPERPGYTFVAWNTKPDGSGTSYTSGSLELQEDFTLYAEWKQNAATNYLVQHYLQNEDENGYDIVNSDTDVLQGIIGTTVTADPKKFEGFTENTFHPSRKPSGVLSKDSTLILKLYYDRNRYQINFDLNGGLGEVPKTQTLRCGEFLPEVTAPTRTGYNFKGWYQDAAGTAELQWDFGKPVEENTDQPEITLYAKWADEIPPVLGEATYGPGYKTLFHWIIRKRGLTITIPILEEGSGMGQAQYFLTPATGNEITKEAKVSEAELPEENADSALSNHEDLIPQNLRIRMQHGQYVAQITLDEDFKGTVSILCTDLADNHSARKLITAGENGVITEDNAPEIAFSAQDGGLKSNITTVNIVVTDSRDNCIVSGIAEISYCIDDSEPISLPKELFEKEIVNSHTFSVDISDPSEHILSVTAVDNAGNMNTQTFTVNHKEPPEETGDDTPAPDRPQPNLPDSGESSPGTPDTNPPETYPPEIDKPDTFPPDIDKPDISPPESNKPTVNHPPVIPTEQPDTAPFPETRIGAPSSREFQGTPFNREPQTGEFTHVEICATLSMIAGFTYLLLYFTEKGGMTEQKKELLVSRLILWAQRGGKFRKLAALAVIFLLLVYYHSIGRQADALEAESYVTYTRRGIGRKLSIRNLPPTKGQQHR